MTKTIKEPPNYNWFEMAEDFVENYPAEDLLRRDNIEQIAIDFQIKYALNPKAALIYIQRAVLKHLGWLPCRICGKESSMQREVAGEKEYYCSDHFPKLEFSNKPKDLESLAIISNISNPSNGKKEDRELIPEENLATTKEPNVNGKTHVLTLEMARDYYKLNDNEFTTIRGKSLSYKTFEIDGEKRRLLEGDIIRITKQRKFFCLCELKDISLRRIDYIPLEVLKRDGEYPGFTINSPEDFLRLINKLTRSRPKKVTLESIKVLLYLKKINGKPLKDLATAPKEQDILEKCNGKNLIQDQDDGPTEYIYEVILKGHQTSISAKTPGLLKRFKFCGKKGCRCKEKGQKHGPYYYQNIRDPETGKQKQIYLGRAV